MQRPYSQNHGITHITTDDIYYIKLCITLLEVLFTMSKFTLCYLRCYLLYQILHYTITNHIHNSNITLHTLSHMIYKLKHYITQVQTIFTK